MSAERFYVVLELYGTTQFYQRETEVLDGKNHFIVKPCFVVDRTQAAKLGEDAALFLADRLRKLGGQPWLEKMDGTRVDLPWKTETGVAIPRAAVRATLDEGDENNPNAKWYKVFPIDRPNGAGQFFVKAILPGLGNPQMFYSTDPLDCLRHARDLGMLQYCERAESPTTPQPAVINSTPVATRRPGDLR
jgi:hypothetical protein